MNAIKQIPIPIDDKKLVSSFFFLAFRLFLYLFHFDVRLGFLTSAGVAGATGAGTGCAVNCNAMQTEILVEPAALHAIAYRPWVGAHDGSWPSP